VKLPVGTDPQRVGIGVTSDVYVTDRARLESTNRTWAPQTTNVGTTRSEVGAEASIGSITGFGKVFLRSSSIVNGDAISKGLVERQPGATVAGQVFENQQTPAGVVDIAELGWRTTLPVSSTNTVMVDVGQTRSLASDAFGDVYVKSGARLSLAGARLFRFRSLIVEPGGIIEVADGLPTEVYVDQNVTFRGSVRTPSAATPPPITLAIFGTGQMSFETSIRALMIAPQGKVVLGGVDRHYYGAIFAQAAELRPDVVLHHIGFNLPSFNPTPGGGGVVNADLPKVPDPFVQASAHCGPRDKLALSGWPIAGFCPAQLSLAPFAGTRTNELHWVAMLTSATQTQPIIGANGFVHVVTADRRLTTLSSDGHEVSHPLLAAPAAAAPTVLRDGSVVVPLTDASVTRVSRQGVVLWNQSALCTSGGTGSKPTGVNVDPDGNLLVGCAGGSAKLLNPTGSLRWSASITGGVFQQPTVGNPGVLLVAGKTQLVRLGRQDGAVLWSRPLSAEPSGPAVLVKDRVYVATRDQKLRAFGVDGAVLWQASLGGQPSGPLAVSPYGVALVPTDGGKLVAVRLDSGQVAYSANVATASLGQVIVGSDGIAYLSSVDKRVRAVAPGSGVVLWTYELADVPNGISLSDSGHVLVSAGQRVVAIGSTPSWTMPDGTTGAGGGGFNPGMCFLQQIVTGNPNCQPGGTGWGSDPTRVGTGGGGGGSGGSGNTGTNVGQSTCLPPTSPSGVTSQGLQGFGYTATVTNGVATGQLSFSPPANVPAGCQLKFCRVDPDGTEHQIDLPFSRVAQNPNEVSNTQACGAVEGSDCPIDPNSNTHHVCKQDSECAAGEVCAVFCEDASCQAPEIACGRRSQCAGSGLAAEPTGPFNQQNAATWPCEELTECAEVDAAFGASGDPELNKSGSLEQRNTPRANFSTTPSVLVPSTYANYSQTLAADPCGAAPDIGSSNSQLDARSGNSGNKKWGLFIEPDLSQDYKIEVSDIIGLPNIKLEGLGSFRAGAYVWGKEIEILNARAEALLSTCGGHLAPSLKVLGIEMQAWQAYASGDLPPAPTPPTDRQVVDCQNALNSLNDQLANIKKGLLDARAAWDAYRRNNSVSPQALCDRTRAILGNVDPGGCTAASARAWLNRYQTLVTQADAYISGQLRTALKGIADQTEGAVAFAPATGGPFADIGATTHYPIGPIVLTLEIDIAGDLDAQGRLSYSMGLDTLDRPDGGPNVRVEAAPGAHVDAYVFVGAGIPGVSVGIEGQLRLIGVSAPLHAAVGISRTKYTDPRAYDSSGLFAAVSGGPALWQAGATQKWSAGWSYGTGVVLDTLSGKINLAVRVRLLFFSKTFRKQVAQWSGLTTKFEFVGKLDQPLSSTAQSDIKQEDVPFPAGSGNLEQAFNATPIGVVLPVSNLGGTSAPGACSCVDLGKACTAKSDCCNGNDCITGICKVPTTPIPPTTPPRTEPGKVK
jgi:hypothetical protein